MALDRESIEKNDFPVGRRGYDPEAVDAHLSALADEIEELKASGGKRGESVAAAAGEQVRAIIDAAESSAAEIKREAAQETKRILREARAEARKLRDKATSDASGDISKVAQSAASLLERIDAMEQEANGVIDTLRTGASRLEAEVRGLESTLRELRDATGTGEEQEEEEAAEVVRVVAVEEPEEPEEPEEAVREDETAEAKEATAAADPDLEGARLIALNMALNGTAREEIDHYLEENFDLINRDALLDEVYASVEG